MKRFSGCKVFPLSLISAKHFERNTLVWRDEVIPRALPWLPSKNIQDYNQEYSCALLKENDIEGLILIRTLSSGVVQPVFIKIKNNTNPLGVMAMINYSFEKISAVLPDETQIYIVCENENGYRLVSRLFDGAKFETVWYGVFLDT